MLAEFAGLPGIPEDEFDLALGIPHRGQSPLLNHPQHHCRGDVALVPDLLGQSSYHIGSQEIASIRRVTEPGYPILALRAEDIPHFPAFHSDSQTDQSQCGYNHADNGTQYFLQRILFRYKIGRALESPLPDLLESPSAFADRMDMPLVELHQRDNRTPFSEIAVRLEEQASVIAELGHALVSEAPDAGECRVYLLVSQPYVQCHILRVRADAWRHELYVEIVRIRGRLAGIGHGIADRENMVAILPDSPAKLQSAVSTVDATFARLPLTGCVHVPLADIAERALDIVIDLEILNGDLPEIVPHQIPLRAGSDGHVPSLDNVYGAVIPDSSLDVDVPDPGLIGIGRQDCQKKQPRHCTQKPAHNLDLHGRHRSLLLRHLEILAGTEMKKACDNVGRHLADNPVVGGNTVIVDHPRHADLILVCVDAVHSGLVVLIGLQLRILLSHGIDLRNGGLESLLLPLDIGCGAASIDGLSHCDNVPEGIVLVLIVRFHELRDGSERIPAAGLLNPYLAEGILAHLVMADKAALYGKEPKYQKDQYANDD